MKHTLTIANLSQLDAAAQDFLREIGPNRIIAIYAPMWAGKTTFTSAVCRALGLTAPQGYTFYQVE